MPSPPAAPRRRFRFAEFTLSPARRWLRRAGGEVPLIPRYLDLLLLLVERRSEALHRREIFDRVWSDVVVSDGALTQAVRTLRRALGEDGGARVFIRTVSRHGYQFVFPVAEEDDADEAGAATNEAATAPPPGPNRGLLGGAEPDPFAAPLGRLLDPAGGDDAWREAAEELHGLGTTEALRRIDGRPGHARAWAFLRDSRWDAPQAGTVPLFSAPAGPEAWARLARLRLNRALRLAGERWAAASAGGAAAGVVAGLSGGLSMGALGSGAASASLLAGLCFVGAFVGGVGAAGVGCGLAAAEALIRSRRTLALTLFGAAGGGAVGAMARHLVEAALAGIFGLVGLRIGGGLEGVVLGASAGLGYALATRRAAGGMATPRGAARARAAAAAALACGLAGSASPALDLRLGAASLAEIVSRFPSSQVRLDTLGRLLGEAGLGPRTRGLVGAAEGLLFGAGLVGGLTRRPRSRSSTES
jgi:DNA-binding winged helix-turn-helix (wHTH) protein